jgi:acyl-CoA dehydrogenase
MSSNDSKQVDGGRADLIRWQDAQQENFFLSDPNFLRLLNFYKGDKWLDQRKQEFSDFGERCATILNQAAEINNRNENLPRLERHDGVGQVKEEIDHHPSYVECGRVIYGSGMMKLQAEPGSFFHSLALFYLSNQNSEAGHNCPVACTAGVVRVLSRVVEPKLREKFLPQLVDPNFDTNHTGAQFLTEIQGGSDVGTNDCRVVAGDTPGSYRLSGEKWFCSSADADIFLITARFDAALPGTKGLGLFLVPRRLEDGTINGFSFRRLKDKLGTRSMASGEMDFEGAVAYAVGPVERGFKTVMENVIHLSRIYNTLAVAGGARRGYKTALSYAQHRRAFGKAIVEYPLVLETLARLRVDSAAMLSGAMYCCDQQDRVDTLSGAETDDPNEALLYQRTLANLNKYRSAYTNTLGACRAIEILGGNGAIESFSILPRLLRDAIVSENWEGTHNTLFMQTLKDISRYRVDEIFAKRMDGLISTLEGDSLGDARDLLSDRLTRLRGSVAAISKSGPELASLQARELVADMANLYYGVVLAAEAQWEDHHAGSQDKLALLELFCAFYLADKAPTKDQTYLTLIRRVALQG